MPKPENAEQIGSALMSDCIIPIVRSVSCLRSNILTDASSPYAARRARRPFHNQSSLAQRPFQRSDEPWRAGCGPLLPILSAELPSA